MRWGARGIAVPFVTVVVAALVIPATPARPEVTGSNDHGVFANADWNWTDQATGATGYRMIQGSGPADPSLGPALVSAFGSDFLPQTCPDGTEGLRIVDVGAEGPGRVTVAPAMSGARLVATLDLTTVRTDTCTGTTKTSRTHDTVIALALSADGPVRTEASLWFQLVPSVSFGRSHVRAAMRDGVGWMQLGDRRLRPGWAEFGRIHGAWHVTERDDASVLMALHGDRALATAVADRGSELRAVGTWERYGRRSMAVAVVDVLTLPDGTPSILVGIQRSRTVTCPDGSEAAVETQWLAETPGTLRIGGHLGSADARTTIDLPAVRHDGCTGETRTWTETGLEVSLSLRADGPAMMGRERLALRTPSLQNSFVSMLLRARPGSGSILIGDLERATTSGWIGRSSWSIHGVNG